VTALYDIYAIEQLIQEGTLFITPNERMARAMEAAFDQFQIDLGVTSWRPLAVLSLSSFVAQSLEEACLPCPVSASQCIYLLRRIIDDHVSSSASVSLLSPQQLAKAAFQAFELVELYELSNRPDFESRMKASPNGAAFLVWRSALIRELKDRGLASEAMLRAELCKLAPHTMWSRIVLVDFDTHTPLGLRFLRMRCAELVDHSSVSGTTDFLSPTSANARLVSYPDRQEQFAQVATRVRDLFLSDDQTHIGIVVPQLEQERSSLERALRREFKSADVDYEHLPINFSAGMPASRVPLIKSALQLLELTFGELKADDLVALCHSPFCSLAGCANERAVVTELISELGIETCTKQTLAILTDELSRRIPDAQLIRFWVGVRALAGKGQSTESLSRDFVDVLQRAGWPGERSIDSVEFQALDLWRECLASWNVWQKIQYEWSARQALSVLTDILAGRVFQPQTPDRAIQVLGTLEAGGLYFDHLFVLDADEHEFPKVTSLSPFIPVDWQREFGLPRSSAHRELQLAGLQLSGFVQRSGQVEFSYVRVKDEISVRSSPILRALEVCAYEALRQPMPTSALEFVSDPAGSALSSAVRELKGGTYRIATQSQCAFKGYAKYRLALPEFEKASRGLLPQEQGALLHKALEYLWKNRSGVDEVNDQHIPIAVERALRTLAPSRRMLLPNLVIEAEQARLVSALNQWLELERARPHFEVLALEDPVPLELGGFTFSMRPDRIDKVGAGLFVIDYKSRAPSASKLLSARLEEPQLPIYALALESVIGCAFGTVSSVLKPELQGLSAQTIAKGVKVADDWDDLMRQWRQRLEELLNDIRQGDARVNPTASACTFCSYANVCRVRALAVEGAEDE